MPNIIDNAPRGPEDDAERPWFNIRAEQLQAMAKFAGNEKYATVRVEAMGAGYWQVTRIDADGNLTDDRTTIHAEVT
jgi:hypothetical protein